MAVYKGSFVFHFAGLVFQDPYSVIEHSLDLQKKIN